MQMECDLVIEVSPLIILNSSVEAEKLCLNNDNNTRVGPEAQGFCSSDVLDHNTIFPQDVEFPAETSFLTPGWVEEGGVFSQPSKSNRNNYTKQESTRILDIIKYSPKFLRKKNAKQPCKNVSPSVEESNNVLHGELNQQLEKSLGNPGSVSPKMGFRKKLQLSASTKDTAVTENSKSAISDQENSESGPSIGRKNWRKVKAALKRMNDGGEQLKPVLASSEENIQLDAKLRIKLPSETSIQDDNENEEDVYQRLKAFLNSNEKKIKTPWSPRLLPLRNKFSFWPKGGEAGDVPQTATPAIEEENVFSSPLSCNQFPVLKSKMYPLEMRRCSAPEPVLRREAEAFSFMKKAKAKSKAKDVDVDMDMDVDVKMNFQNRFIRHEKANNRVQKSYDFKVHEVKQKMRLVMEKSLKNLTEYCPEICGQLNATITKEITEYLHSTADIGSTEDEEKKVICLVYIGAVKDDGIHAAVRCLWCPGEDRLVVSDYQNNSLYALAVVFTASC